LRKRIEKDLPQIEDKLRMAILSWETKQGTPFTLNGERLVDLLADEQAEELRFKLEVKAKKEKERQERLGIVSSQDKENSQNGSIGLKPKTPMSVQKTASRTATTQSAAKSASKSVVATARTPVATSVLGSTKKRLYSATTTGNKTPKGSPFKSTLISFAPYTIIVLL
jgi:hypothetical protein